MAGSSVSPSSDVTRAKDTGSIAATGAQAAVTVQGAFNILLSGPFVASVAVQASLDGGTVYVPETDMLGQPAVLTQPGLYLFTAPEAGTVVRLNCTGFTSGPIGWRISQ